VVAVAELDVLALAGHENCLDDIIRRYVDVKSIDQHSRVLGRKVPKDELDRFNLGLAHEERCEVVVEDACR
jgi:hypothetical protein